MSQPQFEVVSIGNNCFVVNDRDRTVATITSQGYIDWLLKSPMEPGPRVESLRKETHLGMVFGLKINLEFMSPSCPIESFAHRIEENGAKVVLVGDCRSKDGKWVSRTVATLSSDARHTRYEWKLDTTLTCTAAEPQELGAVEYNNVYPSHTGRCMLYAPKKKFRSTLMVDRDGVVWDFPHQHMMHYTTKINMLQFANGSLSGFFGEKTGSPVVIAEEISGVPDWGICDMYYDLHCQARLNKTVQPGQQLRFRYTIKYLSHAESVKLTSVAKPIPITDEDRKHHDYPRIELGMNAFKAAVNIGGFDDASGFRPKPPQKVWDRDTGHSAKGSLRITNDKSEVTVWSAEPPSEIPSQHKLNITAMVKTQNVTGKGVYLRLRYHTFHWHPQPHVQWLKEIESTPVTGTTPGWVKITVPELNVPEEHFDFLIWFDVILEGQGVAWVTDVDVDLQPVAEPPPAIEQGSSKRAKAPATAGKAGSGAAM